jgi:hypothetical protein
MHLPYKHKVARIIQKQNRELANPSPNHKVARIIQKQNRNRANLSPLIHKVAQPVEKRNRKSAAGRQFYSVAFVVGFPV